MQDNLSVHALHAPAHTGVLDFRGLHPNLGSRLRLRSDMFPPKKGNLKLSSAERLNVPHPASPCAFPLRRAISVERPNRPREHPASSSAESFVHLGPCLLVETS